jgi:serine protease AprX
MSSITINGITIDPEAQAPAMRALSLHSADASQSDFILIQTRAPLDKAQRVELEGKGVKVLEYVPESAYLCHYPPADLEALRALPYVEWVNVYLEGFKIAPSLQGVATARAPADLTALASRSAARANNELKKVDLVFHANVDFEQVRARVAAAAGLDPQDLKLAGNKVRIKVKAQRLADLAQIDEVRHIEEVFPAKLHNDVARRILRVETGNPPTALFEGEGQIVTVCDTGFDKGSTTDVHPAFAGRVLRLYALGRPNSPSDPDGHGTHVAGSVLADGNSAVLGHMVRGTAPKAKLILQSVLDNRGGLGGLPDDLGDLFLAPYQNDHARIHTNSWGSVVGNGAYSSNSRELDDFVWKHRDCVVCFSAGNEANDVDADGRVRERSATPPGTAKNCITVGASENLRPEITRTYGSMWPPDFPADPIRSDNVADDAEGMVAFSGRGPTADGRIKPDVVAPGTFILSTRSRATADNGWRLSGDQLYFFMGGTSMATPLVAG